MEDMVPKIAIPLGEVARFSKSFAYGLMSFVSGVNTMRKPDTERDSHALASRDLRPLHRHNYEAIQALNRELESDETRFNDATLSGIGIILSCALNQGATEEWRTHYHAIWTFVNARGGYRHNITIRAGPVHDMIGSVILGHAANSTSPSTDQIQVQPGLTDLDVVMEAYNSTVWVSFLCPPPLFIELMRINDLRARQAQLHDHKALDTASLSEDFLEPLDLSNTSSRGTTIQQRWKDTGFESIALVKRVLDVDLSMWAWEKDAGRGHHKTWLQFGNMYKSAMVIYADLSLMMAPDEAQGSFLEASRRLSPCQRQCQVEKHAMSLAMDIKIYLERPQHLHMALCWPTVALGVLGARAPTYRGTVTQCLLRLGREHGTALPYQAQEVLKAYWATGKTEWDECFDRPYVFQT